MIRTTTIYICDWCKTESLNASRWRKIGCDQCTYEGRNKELMLCSDCFKARDIALLTVTLQLTKPSKD